MRTKHSRQWKTNF